MPISKPQQIFGGSATPVVKRARDSAAESRQAMNALLGRDNFSKLLESSGESAQETAKSQHSDTGYAGGQSTVGGQARPPGGGMQQTLAASLNAKSTADLHSMGFNTSQSEVQKFQSMSTLQRAMQQSSNPLAVVNSLNYAPGFRPQGLEAVQLGLRTVSHRNREALSGDKADSETARTDPAGKTDPSGAVGASLGEAVSEAVGQVVEQSIGALSAMFESGTRGVAAIGYDRTGGTSYGKYQIASRTGAMDEFVNFLQTEAPDLAKRLQEAGAANTGSRQGKMPMAWKAIAAEEPERFAALQQQFIGKSHYGPAMAGLSEQLGLNEAELSPTMREVIFSTAVQHGANGAGRIISRAMNAVGLDRLNSSDPQVAMKAEQDVIRKVYDHRATQFTSSTSEVRASVQSRLKTEMNMALSMLKSDSVA